MKSHNFIVRPAGVGEVGEAEVDEHQRRRSHPITTFAFFAIFAHTRTTTITIAPLVPRQRAVDQHVPQLDVPVHYADCVERAQHYKEVAEVLLHLPLRQAIVLLVIVIVVLLSFADAIIIVPAVGCASRCRLHVVVASLLMPPMPTSAVAEPLGFGTSVHHCCSSCSHVPR